MRWYKDLYTGILVGGNRDKLILKIDKGDYPGTVWLITLSDQHGGRVELYKASELKHDFVRKHCIMIAGLAMSRNEAEGLLADMYRDLFASGAGTDLAASLMKDQLLSRKEE